MDIEQLKEYIFDNNKVKDILKALGCHHVKLHSSEYYTAGNPDGDNNNAITVYLNNNLNTIDYTRDICKIGSKSDIISLVEFFRQESFFESIKWICNVIGIDIYFDFNDIIPESIKITKLLFEMQNGVIDNNDDKPLKPRPEKILTYYKSYVNDLFKNDGINYYTQKQFEIGYDNESNRITIPIRDEYGILVGVKGRLFKEELNENDTKYVYIEPCNKSKILYGLHKTYKYVKDHGTCYIFESEKSVMQMWAIGIYNCVSTGGKQISNSQIEKLTRMGVDLIFAYDKDVEKSELENIADRFIDGVNIYILYDDKNILNEKESPSDNKNAFYRLINECKYKVK